MKKLFRAILWLIIAAALLFLGLYIYASFNQPKDVKPYSEQALHQWVDSLWQNGVSEESRRFATSDYKALAAEVEAYTDRLYEENPRYCYSVSNCSYNVEGYRRYTELHISFQYKQQALPYDALPRVADPQSALSVLYPSVREGARSLDFLAEGSWSEDDVTRLAAALFSNAVETAAECTHYSYSILSGEESVVHLEARYDLDEDTLREASAAMQSELDRIADAIRAQNLGSQREQYTAIAMAVIESSEYDSDVALATYTDDLSDSQKLRRSAYGAVIEGKTVCSGYAMAFQALCDRLELPCWLIPGYLHSSGHEWNVIRIGENTYFIDCCSMDKRLSTFEDEELDPDDLFMRAGELEDRGYLWSSSQLSPWDLGA